MAAKKPEANVPAVQRISVPGIEKLDDEMLAELEGVEGAGLSDNVEDRGTPLLYLAQKNSPQVEPRDAKYIEGLKPGMAFNNLTGEKYDAENDGIVFLPCFMKMTWDEWTPRDNGGGFHGSHDRNTPLIRKAKPFIHPKSKKTRRDIYVMDNGHELKLTARYYGVIAATWSPIVLPMASTNLGCSTKLQALISAMKIETGGRIIPKPAFWTKFLLKTTYETNDDGNWFQWTAGIEGKNEDKQLREFCKAFAMAASRNEVKEAAPVEEMGGAPNDDDIPV